MKKILVIRYGTIGDSIFATAFFRELRKNYPNALIDALVDNKAKGLLLNCPYIDGFVDILNEKHKVINIFKYISQFKKYDTVFFLKSAKTFSIIAKLAGIKNRIGFDTKINKFLTVKIPYNEDKHEIDYYLGMLKFLNLKVENDKPELKIPQNDIDKVSVYKSDKPLVIIQAYGRDAEKNWIDKYWCKLIKYLSDELGAQIYYIGAKKDLQLYSNLENTMIKRYKKFVGENLSGKLSVSETLALISLSDMVISIDSCAAHMAAALAKPQILIHGNTSLKRWMPRNEKCIVASKYFPCSPCVYQTGKDMICNKKVPRCMFALKTEDVISKIQELSEREHLTLLKSQKFVENSVN